MGRGNFGGGNFGPQPPVRQSRLMGTNGDFHSVSSSLFTSSQARAFYIGRTGEARSTIDLGFYLHGASASGAGWAEIAVARGSFPALVTANIDLTVLGYADISADVLSATTSTYTKSLTGLNIGATDDLWVIAACAFATTQMTFRIMNDDGERIGARRKRAAFQPSLNVGTPQTFAYAAADPSTIMFGFLP